MASFLCTGTRTLAPSTPARVSRVPHAPVCIRRRSALRVRSQQQGEPPKPEDLGSPGPAASLSSFKQSCDKFMGRYDFLSTGVGALVVTTWCVLHGQDVSTAASITVCAVIMALVLNELLFTDDASSQPKL